MFRYINEKNKLRRSRNIYQPARNDKNDRLIEFRRFDSQIKSFRSDSSECNVHDMSYRLL